MAFSRTSTTAYTLNKTKVREHDLFVALIRNLWIAVAIWSNEQGNHPIGLRNRPILQVICGILSVRLAPKA